MHFYLFKMLWVLYELLEFRIQKFISGISAELGIVWLTEQVTELVTKHSDEI